MRLTLSSLANLLKRQVLYIAFSLAVTAIFWALGQEINPFTIIVYSISLGNLTAAVMETAWPLYNDRRFPYNWLTFLAILGVALLPIYVISATLAWWITSASRLGLGRYLQTGWKFPILITAVAGIGIFLYETTKKRLEKRNQELQ